MRLSLIAVGISAAATLACRGKVSGCGPAMAVTEGTLAQVFYWRAKPGRLEEYNRYIRDVAEPIDGEAQKAGAFISVTTLVSLDTLSPWTHMRVFVLRDSAQAARLSAALDTAGMRLEPDSVKRRVRGEYAVTLRDRVGGALLHIVR